MRTRSSPSPSHPPDRSVNEKGIGEEGASLHHLPEAHGPSTAHSLKGTHSGLPSPIYLIRLEC